MWWYNLPKTCLKCCIYYGSSTNFMGLRWFNVAIFSHNLQPFVGGGQFPETPELQGWALWSRDPLDIRISLFFAYPRAWQVPCAWSRLSTCSGGDFEDEMYKNSSRFSFFSWQSELFLWILIHFRIIHSFSADFFGCAHKKQKPCRPLIEEPFSITTTSWSVTVGVSWRRNGNAHSARNPSWGW